MNWKHIQTQGSQGQVADCYVISESMKTPTLRPEQHKSQLYVSWKKITKNKTRWMEGQWNLGFLNLLIAGISFESITLRKYFPLLCTFPCIAGKDITSWDLNLSWKKHKSKTIHDSLISIERNLVTVMQWWTTKMFFCMTFSFFWKENDWSMNGG